MMKKLIALLLTCCMLFGYAATAEESIMQEAFLNGASALLQSIDLSRDMLNLTVDYLQENVFSARLKGQDNMLDLSAATADFNIHTQISDTDISVKADDTILNLQYADVEALLSSLTGQATPDIALYQEIITLFFQNVIMPDMVIDETDGLHVTYSATWRQMFDRLSGFVDLIAANEKYSAAMEQVFQLIASFSGTEAPTLAQLKEEIAASEKKLAAADSDYAAKFELNADSAYTKIDVSGEIGTSLDKYAMNWAYTNDGDAYKLDGSLWEQRVMGEKTRKYEITVKAAFRGNEQSNLWNLSITHPSIGFNLEASGNMEGNMGSFCLYYNHLYMIETGFMVQVDYAMEDEGLIATALVTPGRMGNYIATLVAGEKQFNLTVKNYAGRKLLLLNLLADEDKNLKYGYMEYQPDLFMGNPYNPRISDVNKVTAEYDGEKLVITTNGITVTCTGEFESDHAYVITLHPEGEHLAPGQNDAYIRLEYQGEEGSFTFSGRVIDPNGNDALAVRFSCSPTEGINELLRDMEGAIHLTPETLQMLIAQ